MLAAHHLCPRQRWLPCRAVATALRAQLTASTLVARPASRRAVATEPGTQRQRSWCFRLRACRYSQARFHNVSSASRSAEYRAGRPGLLRPSLAPCVSSDYALSHDLRRCRQARLTASVPAASSVARRAVAVEFGALSRPPALATSLLGLRHCRRAQLDGVVIGEAVNHRPGCCSCRSLCVSASALATLPLRCAMLPNRLPASALASRPAECRAVAACGVSLAAPLAVELGSRVSASAF